MNKRLSSHAMLVAGLALDYMAVRALIGTGWLGIANVGEYAIWHMLSVLAIYGAFRKDFPNANRASQFAYGAMALGFCLTLPLAGQFMMACLAGVIKLPPKKGQGGTRLVVGENKTLTEGRYFNPSVKQSVSVLEILHGMDENARRNAILGLRHLDRQKALPVLQKAIQDSDEQVRLLAQTRYNKIVSSLEVRIKRMERELEKKERSAYVLVRLAEQYHELVYLGISSPETADIYLDRAIELLREALQKDPEKLTYNQMMIRCLVRRNHLEEALSLIDKVRQMGCQVDFTMPWEAEIHYRLKDWKALEGLLKDLDRTDYLAQRIKALVDFWLSPDSTQPSATP